MLGDATWKTAARRSWRAASAGVEHGAHMRWSDLGAVVPLLDQPARHWKEQPWRALFKHIGLSITVPLYVNWLFLSRLTVWTAQKVERPKEIKDAIGQLINGPDLRSDKHGALRPGRPPPL